MTPAQILRRRLARRERGARLRVENLVVVPALAKAVGVDAAQAAEVVWGDDRPDVDWTAAPLPSTADLDDVCRALGVPARLFKEDPP